MSGSTGFRFRSAAMRSKMNSYFENSFDIDSWEPADYKIASEKIQKS